MVYEEFRVDPPKVPRVRSNTGSQYRHATHWQIEPGTETLALLLPARSFVTIPAYRVLDDQRRWAGFGAAIEAQWMYPLISVSRDEVGMAERLMRHCWIRGLVVTGGPTDHQAKAAGAIMFRNWGRRWRNGSLWLDTPRKPLSLDDRLAMCFPLFRDTWTTRRLTIGELTTALTGPEQRNVA